jgi:hypothetical protein
MTRLFILLTLCVNLASGQAQTILESKTKWSSTSLFDSSTNASSQLRSYFIVDHATTITWVQKNGELSYNFTITEVSGQWNNINEPGSIEFTVSINGLTGQFILSRNEEGLRIKSTLLNNGVNEMPFDFIIDNVQTEY